MVRTLQQWQQLAKADPQAWLASVRDGLARCGERTGTSVLSANLADREPQRKGPLAGVPCAVKDLFNFQGTPAHCSSVLPPLLNQPAPADSELVTRLRSLGASCVAKTQMNEFAYGLSGENPHYGDCPHPRLRGCLSGGSSSGSAYLVATGCLPLAFGTDTGGSIRLPAAWCGLYGIRWTPGYHMQGAFPLAPSLDTMGWFTSGAGDMITVLRAWFGLPPLQRNPTAAAVKGALLNPHALLAGEVRHAVGKQAAALGISEAGETAELEALLPACNHAFNVIQSREAFAVHKSWLSSFAHLYDPAVRACIERGAHWNSGDIGTADSTAQRVKKWFADWFRSNDYLAMPVCPEPAIPPAQATPGLRENTLQLTAPASLAGLPALTIPVWLDSKRTVGIQFIFASVDARVPLSLLQLCENS